MTVDAFPDTEGAIRGWLRDQVAVRAVVGNRVFFGVPKAATEATFPLITVQLVSTIPDGASDAPLDRALLQIDCWGSIDASGNGQKATCSALVNTVRALLHSITQPTPMGTVTVFGCNVESVTWLPDPANDRPRYSVTAEVTAITP